MGFGFSDITDSIGLTGGDDALKAQEADNKRRWKWIEEQTGLAIEDLERLYNLGDAYRNRVTNDTLAYMSGHIIPQMDYFQQGNVDAQRLWAAAPQQYQNALFGHPVDYSAFQVRQYDLPEPGTFDTSLPTYSDKPQPQQSPYQAPNQYPASGGRQGGGINPMQAGDMALSQTSYTGPSLGQWAALATAIKGADKANWPSDGLSPSGQVHTYAQLGENLWNNGIKKPVKAIDKGVSSIADWLGGLF